MFSLSFMETLTRIGFAARGLLYVTIGFVAIRTGRSEDHEGALEQLSSGAGAVVLTVMALGFLAYAIWRLSEAAIDSEGNGGEAKGLAVRAGGAVSGVVHLGLAVAAIRLAAGSRGAAGSSEQDGAATALSLPGGEVVVAIVAAALIAAGLFQLVKAVRATFMKHLAPEAAGKSWIEWSGRIGYAARGVVFVLIGIFALNAARESDATEVGGTGAALAALPPALFIAVAAGFLLFGVFSFVEARFRRINDPHVIDRLKARIS